MLLNGQPSGLFWGFRVGTSGGARLELDTRLFFGANRIARAFPFGGVASFDPSRCNPDTCGTFEVVANSLAVRWDDGNLQRYALELTGEGIRLDGTLFRPAKPLTAQSLIGEWSSGQAGGNPFYNGYRFDPDGRFSFGTGDHRVRGRYAVEGLTLVLTFDDGEVSRRTLFSASRDEPAGLIGVEGEVYARR